MANPGEPAYQTRGKTLLNPWQTRLFSRSLSFYSTARPTLDKVGRIQNVETVPLTALWIPDGETERLLYGDDKGALHDLQFGEEWGA